MNKIIALVVAVVVVVLVASSAVFMVDPRHVAIVSSSGGANATLAGPGLHVKLPPPFQTVTWIDTRVQAFDAPDADRYTTSDKTELLVNPVVRYRISDPLKLFAATKGDAQTLADRLAALSRDALSDAFSKVTLTEALGQQEAIANGARDALRQTAAALGIDVISIELTRVDYPPELAETVFKRMSAAREQAAAETREKGAAEAQQIKDDAERKQQGVVADAYAQAQAIKGEGDGKAAAIAAEAFGRDPDFYRFYQSMLAYRESFRPGDVIVVDSSSEFFRFMRGPNGGTGGGDTSQPSAAPRKH
ncbi:protease modulator HflC [Paraburkholderia unamae]|uniref:Protein HflC n=1 Tax=Paraburkholderia unamae TaxID=219649 RepID=A0ABX5KST9_9BURK|nr:protease modulator HflC [Paraburkholderia unamae]PVX83391.1 protease FtsH subunit HflC [Paraburkholderia unamae]RAR60089.1 protease FtsH subunit HflC [Paraburkholderia unamae]